MPDPNEFKAVLERLLAGTVTDADRNALRTALTSGVLVTGERAVALGGNASDVIITTGDQNIVLSFKGVDADTVKEALSSIAPTRLHQVPPPPADFTGRKDELEELLVAIEHGGVTISGLQGLGGIGKTALALKLVEQLKPRYPDAQFYLDLKGASNQPLTVNEALAYVVRAYHPTAKLPDSQNELHGLFLSALDGKRALLLMDNAASAEQVAPLIPPAGCVLVVTSRWHFTLPGLAAKNLDTLTAGDARALLLAIAPRIGEWADEIAKLCGCLPLALRLAAGVLATYRNLKPADYVHRLQDQQQRLELIEASFSLSYELLGEELRERWRWLAVFTDSFADSAAADMWGVAMVQAQQTLGELLAASMVEWNKTTGRYRLHDLAWLFANTKLSAAERSVGLERHASHYLRLLVTIAGALDDRRDEGNVLGVLGNLGIALVDLWEGNRAIEFYVQQLSVVCELDNRKNEGNALGIAYANSNENQHAIQFYQRRFFIACEITDWGGAGDALWDLSLALDQLGKRAQAIKYAEQSLSFYERIENPNSAKVHSQLAAWREELGHD